MISGRELKLTLLDVLDSGGSSCPPQCGWQQRPGHSAGCHIPVAEKVQARPHAAMTADPTTVENDRGAGGGLIFFSLNISLESPGQKAVVCHHHNCIFKAVSRYSYMSTR